MNDTALFSKAALRQDLLQKRMEISPAARLKAAEAMCEAFFEHVSISAGMIVAGYWPIRNEIDDIILLRRLLQKGTYCALPCIEKQNKPLVFRPWNESTLMTVGNFSIPEPTGGGAALTPDIVIVPMAAFDMQRHRLGYGAGYYDRTLAQLKAERNILAVGVAYDTQVLPRLPIEENDVRMDMIITDKKVYK